MSLSPWDEGSDSDQVRGYRDNGLVGHCKILAWQMAKLPRYRREGAVEVRPFTAKKKHCASEVQGLSREAMKGNPLTTVILRVDESKSSPRTNEDLIEPVSISPKLSKNRQRRSPDTDHASDCAINQSICRRLARRILHNHAISVPVQSLRDSMSA
jgi:hypothetical protein